MGNSKHDHIYDFEIFIRYSPTKFMVLNMLSIHTTYLLFVTMSDAYLKRKVAMETFVTCDRFS